MPFPRLIVLASTLCLCACAHEAENTGSENSSIEILSGTYAFENTAATVGNNSVVGAGHVSRFQRHVIVPGGPDGEMTPCAKNFDAVMDNLEGLMTPQIEENNRIAAEQQATYGVLFPGRHLSD